jgi:hypothetical protein
MSKRKKFFIIFIAVSLVIAYSLYYYVYTNINWKLTGLDLTEKTEGDSENKLNFGSSSILERIVVKLNITNNSGLPFKVSRFRMKIVNAAGTNIGDINTIRSVSVPANSLQIVEVNVNNVNELGLVSDALSGRLKDYDYVVSGWLGGFLPFRYKGKLM